MNKQITVTVNGSQHTTGSRTQDLACSPDPGNTEPDRNTYRLRYDKLWRLHHFNGWKIG